MDKEQIKTTSAKVDVSPSDIRKLKKAEKKRKKFEKKVLKNSKKIEMAFFHHLNLINQICFLYVISLRLNKSSFPDKPAPKHQ